MFWAFAAKGALNKIEILLCFLKSAVIKKMWKMWFKFRGISFLFTVRQKFICQKYGDLYSTGRLTGFLFTDLYHSFKCIEMLRSRFRLLKIYSDMKHKIDIILPRTFVNCLHYKKNLLNEIDKQKKLLVLFSSSDNHEIDFL